MPYCDHGHYAEEVRRMPTGSGSAILVCYLHYLHEINYRRERNKELSKELRYVLPEWEHLPVYWEG